MMIARRRVHSRRAIDASRDEDAQLFLDRQELLDDRAPRSDTGPCSRTFHGALHAHLAAAVVAAGGRLHNRRAECFDRCDALSLAVYRPKIAKRKTFGAQPFFLARAVLNHEDRPRAGM